PGWGIPVGALPGGIKARARSPKVAAAALPPVRLAALASIHAAAVAGAKNASMLAETSSAIPIRAAGSGVRLRTVLFQGLAVTCAPAARCAAPARAPRMLSLPGGASVSTAVAVRGRLAASVSARVSLAAV